MNAECEGSRDPHLKAEVERQARLIQSLQRQLKNQRESIGYVRSDRDRDQDEGQSNEDTLKPNTDEMNDFDLANESASQAAVIHRLLGAVEQGMEDLLEPDRKDQVDAQAEIIRSRLRQLKVQSGYIEFLKTGSDQALTQASSTDEMPIDVPSLEEMNKLDLKVQIELQIRIIETLNRALEPGRIEIAELERQNHQWLYSLSAPFVKEVEEDPPDPRLKAEVQNQARLIQSLKAQLKEQGESIGYVRGDSNEDDDEYQSHEDLSDMMANIDLLNDPELRYESDYQRGHINTFRGALEQGMDDLLERHRKDQIQNQAAIIKSLLRHRTGQAEYVEYLKTGNDQALTQDSSTVHIPIEVPSLEEMNKLDLKAQLELQGRIIDTLERAVGLGRIEIAELERQNRERQARIEAELGWVVEEDVADPELKARVEKQARLVQSLQRQLKDQRESIGYLRGDSHEDEDEGQANEDTSIVSQFVMPNTDGMNNLQLAGESQSQGRVICSLLGALEQGMEDLLEPKRKAEVENQAARIRYCLRQLKDQSGYIEFLKTGNDQALTQASSTDDMPIEVPSLEEMNKLDLKAQIELQGRIIETLNRALEPGDMEIAELERQNHHRQDRVDATLAQCRVRRGATTTPPADRDHRSQVGDVRSESRDESAWKPQIRDLVSSRLECSRSMSFRGRHESSRAEVSADLGGEAEKLIRHSSPIGARRRRKFRAEVSDKAAVRTGDSHGAWGSELPFRDPVW
jgi:hypothetical protein